jgi:predicted RNA-binding Zn ribbon-like protein
VRIDLAAESDPRVPAAADAVVRFLNSRAHSVLPDRLGDGPAAAGILRHLDPAAGPPASRRVDRLKAVRSRLLDVVRADGRDALAAAWAEFTAATADVRFGYDFSSPGAALTRLVAGDPVVGGLVVRVAELVAAGTWSRVRVCANPACSGVFYDVTRSRTQRWHSYELCGNKANVAAYRARQT